MASFLPTAVAGLAVALGLLTSSSASAGDAVDATGVLRADLRRILASPGLDGARTGIHIRSLSDGKVLFDRNSDELFNPASNMKLLTTAAALHFLGPSYLFRTEIRRDPDFSDGVVHGHLYVRAWGDPTLTTEAMFGLVNEIALRGVEEVRGNIVIDDRFFDDVTEGPGWEEESGDPAYAAPIGAFSVNFNTFVVRVLPGDRSGAPARARVWPDIDMFDTRVQATTRGRRTRTRLWVGTSESAGDSIDVLVRGRIAKDATAGRSYRRRVHDPSRFAGGMLARMLEMRGIKVRGRVRRGPLPETGTVAVVTHYSPPLAEITGLLNKYSNNFIAEQILKTLGAEILEAPGTWEKGTDVIARFLNELGVPEEAYRLGNGSGLNDVNRVTPAVITQVLSHMYRRFDVRPEFVASLAVAGQSGTIGGRFANTAAVSRIRAKTGSLRGVSTLSGYAVTRDDRVLAFSIMMNGYDGSARSMWSFQDQIGLALARYPYAGPNADVAEVDSPTRRVEVGRSRIEP